jgi:hypothetical protein
MTATRHWKDILRELERETDRQRVDELRAELNRATKEQIKVEPAVQTPSLRKSNLAS